MAYTYDLDGNLTGDDRWLYTWDAENRLIAMETRDVAYNAGTPRQKLEFAYDYLGRRASKKVFNYNGSGWVLASEKRSLYDGWNLLNEYAVSGGNLQNTMTYVWGLDLSNSLQGAGGVGGLLAVIDRSTGETQLPAYDGNGNVVGLTVRNSGTLVAGYEYSPYGESIRTTGVAAKKNPFRFSTKYTDDETGLVYYGRRYYDAKIGRFVGRDPLGEEGGLNLYGLISNSPLNGWDLLGMCGNWGQASCQMYILPDGSKLRGDAGGQIAYRNGSWGVAYDQRNPASQPGGAIPSGAGRNPMTGTQMWHSPYAGVAGDYGDSWGSQMADEAQYYAMYPDGDASVQETDPSGFTPSTNGPSPEPAVTPPTQIGAAKPATTPSPNPAVAGVIFPNNPPDAVNRAALTFDQTIQSTSLTLTPATLPSTGVGEALQMGVYAVAVVDPKSGATTPVKSSDGTPVYAPKNYDANTNIAAAKDSWSPFWFNDQVKPGGPWDYKQTNSIYEHVGNLNYGLTGSAMGIFPERVLLRMAGQAQVDRHTSRPSYGTPGFSPLGIGATGDFGDDWRDQADIRTGISLYKTGATLTTIRVGIFQPPGT